MTPDKIETVKRIFRGWAAGDMHAEADAFDPEIVFVVRPDFPEHGVFQGSSGVREYMRRFLEHWELTTFEAEEIRAFGDTVFVRVIQRGKGAASGIEADQRFFQLFTFRAGKIVRLETVRDERDALEAVGVDR